MAKQTIGEFLATLRKANGYTQQEVANRLGISNRTLSGWECDNVLPDILLLPALAELYGVTVDEILAGERKEKTNIELTTKSEKRILKRKIARFTMQSSILVGIIVAGILLAAFCSFVEATQSAGYIWPKIMLAVGVVAVVVSLGILFAFWKSAELSVDDTMENYHLYCLVLRKKLANCLFVLSATSAIATIATMVGLFVNVGIERKVGGYSSLYATIIVCVSFAICTVCLFLTAWLLYKRGLTKFGGETAKQSIRKDRNHFWAVTFWGIIPVVIAIILIIVFTFVQPVMRETLYENDDIDAFIRYMETFDNGSEEIYIPLSELEKTAEFGVIYEYQDGIYYLFKRNAQEVSAHIYWGNPQDNPISQDYAVKHYSDDGSFSVFDARHHAYLNADRSFVIELYDSGAAVIHIHTLDLSYIINSIATVVIGIDVLIIATLCVKRRMALSIKL